MGLSVLLVDDDESSRIVLSALLEDEGFRVEVAASFAEAEARLSSGARYDLVLLDQHLGDGRGTELLPLARERAQGARVLLVSGSVDQDGADDAGFDGVVPKGASFPDLLARILDPSR
jgi:CheY-like chemotaxis protein